MTRTLRGARRAVTLIELLVVMAILTALLALAAMLVPSITSSDQTQKGAGELQAAFKVAQGMAANTGRPHGVALIVNNGYIATELQFLESPPVVISDPRALVAKANDPTGVNTSNGPRVEFLYNLNTTPPTNPGDPPINSIANRHCYLRGLSADQRAQVLTRSTLVLPTMGVWSRILSNIGTMTDPDEVVLEVYPDAAMGAGTTLRTFHFGVYSVPIPVLAAANVPMPKGIGIDLEVSSPRSITTAQNYIIMFAPNGQPIGTPNVATNTNVYLLVRDIDKFPGSINLPVGTTQLGDAFRRGGEMAIVGVRAGGFVGSAPAMPADANGNYSAQYPDIFSLARQQLDR